MQVLRLPADLLALEASVPHSGLFLLFAQPERSVIADPPCVIKGLLVVGSLRGQGLPLYVEANEFELCFS